MTIEQRVERMFNPGGSTPTGVPVTAVAFASLPPAASVPGQIRTISDVGPAPGIELVSNGTIWRPRGGRQVLAQRTLNPVTVQALSPGQVAETIGPFPGGLVRAGMRLELKYQLGHSGIGSGLRYCYLRFNTVGIWHHIAPTNSGESLMAQLEAWLAIRSDTSAAHIGGNQLGVISFNAGISPHNPVVDFSADWSVDPWLRSAAETAVAIASSSWAGGVATYNTSAASTLAVGDKTTIAGVGLAGYNGVVIVASIVDTDTFTVAMASDPGGSGTGGTSSRISNMISQSYVLELVG